VIFQPYERSGREILEVFSRSRRKAENEKRCHHVGGKKSKKNPARRSEKRGGRPGKSSEGDTGILKVFGKGKRKWDCLDKKEEGGLLRSGKSPGKKNVR